MKTADLIPLILLELNECDKYGFELTKAIETKSGGKIVIKQPTLYTLLKKLEKSKFISSYWEDSEIGGKRHYYKLTQNGKLQVSTFPTYQDLISHALQDEKNEEDLDDVTTPLPTQVEPKETVLPTMEVFNDKGIDYATEMQLNSSNTELLKTDNNVASLNFANNENVIKFSQKSTQNISTDLQNYKDNKKSDIFKIENIDVKTPNAKKDDDIKYVDYINFKHSKEYKQSIAICKKLLISSLIVSVSLMVISLLCSLITQFTGRTALFYVFFISALTIALFYPIIVGLCMEKLRLKYQTQPFRSNTKIKFWVSISVVLTVLLSCVIVNISIGNNSIVGMLKWNNFSNFYAPLVISSVSFIDVIASHMLLRKIQK